MFWHHIILSRKFPNSFHSKKNPTKLQTFKIPLMSGVMKNPEIVVIQYNVLEQI